MSIPLLLIYNFTKIALLGLTHFFGTVSFYDVQNYTKAFHFQLNIRTLYYSYSLIDEQRRFTMKGGERGKNKIPHLSKGK